MNRLYRTSLAIVTAACLVGISAPATADPGASLTARAVTASRFSPADVSLNGWTFEDGSWCFYVQGQKKTGWHVEGGTWYYLDPDGAMARGWVQVGSAWYYFTGSGAMQSGTWIPSGGTWYYLTSSGAMATSTWIGDYYVRADGAVATGWTLAGGTWYRFNGSGRWMSVYAGTYTCPSWAPIKGNKDSMIYHRPGQGSYRVTKAEECFASGSDAAAAGYRAARN